MMINNEKEQNELQRGVTSTSASPSSERLLSFVNGQESKGDLTGNPQASVMGNGGVGQYMYMYLLCGCQALIGDKLCEGARAKGLAFLQSEVVQILD